MGYLDVNFAGCKLDRKSISGTYQFLGNCLVSWNNKKQDLVAFSMIEAEYMVMGSYCTQNLWMKR